jgi:hypothetical protein
MKLGSVYNECQYLICLLTFSQEEKNNRRSDKTECWLNNFYKGLGLTFFLIHHKCNRFWNLLILTIFQGVFTEHKCKQWHSYVFSVPKFSDQRGHPYQTFWIKKQITVSWEFFYDLKKKVLIHDVCQQLQTEPSSTSQMQKSVTSLKSMEEATSNLFK